MAKLIESHAVAPMEQDATGKAWKLKIIEGDTQGSSAYYPATVLEAQPDIVKPGTRIYLDHPSLSESEDRPERSARDIIGYFRTGSTYEGGSLMAEAEFFSEWQTWVKERAQAGVIGMSIRGSGSVEEADGVPTLKKFDTISSVDLVTVPGAKGGFEEILESERANVREKETNMEMPKELAEALDAQAKDVKTLTESNTALVTAVQALVEALKPAEKVEESAKPGEVAEALIESGLTKSARARVLTAVDGGTDLAEAIKAEKEIQAEILAEAETKIEGNLQESVKGDELVNGFM